MQLKVEAYAKWLVVPGRMCSFQPTCGTALALEHNGDLFSCDHLVDPDYFLGNVMDQELVKLASSAAQRQFGERKWKIYPRNAGFVKFCLSVREGAQRIDSQGPDAKRLEGIISVIPFRLFSNTFFLAWNGLIIGPTEINLLP